MDNSNDYAFGSKEHILDCIDYALSLSGYTIYRNAEYPIIVRAKSIDLNFGIKIEECTP